MPASLPHPAFGSASLPAIDLRLYAVLDPARCRGRGLADLAVAAVRGGATCVQLRDKRGDAAVLRHLAEELVEALLPTGVPLIVNDQVELARLAGAAGVHLGRDDASARAARDRLGPGAVIGVTVHHAREADAVDPADATYAGIGPVFVTASKRQDDPPIGPDGLGRLVRRLRDRLPGFPCCGIAGVTHGNAAEVVAAGADGVAVISGIFMADDVEAAARRLRRAVDLARQQERPA